MLISINKCCRKIGKGKEMTKISKKIQESAGKIDVIMRNRLIIAIFLIVDGLNFLIFRDDSLTGMATSIAFLVLITSITVLISSVTAIKKDISSIIIALIVIGLCIFTFFFPKIVANYLKLILSIFIITNGVINTLNILKLNKLSAQILSTRKNMENKINEKSHSKEYRKEVRSQIDKILNTTNKVVDSTSKFPYLYLIINIMSIILGLWLFIYPNVTIFVWGIIFIYTGLTNFMVSARSMNLRQKLQKREFKKILFN